MITENLLPATVRLIYDRVRLRSGRNVKFFPEIPPKPRRTFLGAKKDSGDEDKTTSTGPLELEKHLVMLYCIIAFTVGRREEGTGGKIAGYRSFFWYRSGNGTTRDDGTFERDPTGKYGKIRLRSNPGRPQDEKLGKDLIKDILDESGEFKSTPMGFDLDAVELFYPVKTPVKFIDHTKPEEKAANVGGFESARPEQTKTALTFDEDWSKLKDDWSKLEDDRSAKEQYTIFCNWSFQVFLEWMSHWFPELENTVYDVLGIIIRGLVTRETALKLSQMNITGTPISFPIIRPMIGRHLDRDKFEKERTAHFTKGRGKREFVKAVLGAGLTVARAVVGSAGDTIKVNETIIDTISAGGRFILQSGESQSSIIFGVVRNEMRGFLVRTRDVIGILSTITDELTRQQRRAEIHMRDVKRSIRHDFNGDPTKSHIINERNKALAYEEAEFRSGTKAIASSLMNEVLDVSVHISLGYYYIYKIWSELTDGVSTIPDRKNENIGDVRENQGELEIMHSMMWYFEDESSSSSMYEFLKKSAQFLGNKEYVEQLKFAFRSYEQDLRDGIQDVELALSAYRMRIDAENELFNLVAINGLTIKERSPPTFVGSVPASVPASVPGPPWPSVPGPPRPLSRLQAAFQGWKDKEVGASPV